jgi:hypothetical protein
MTTARNRRDRGRNSDRKRAGEFDRHTDEDRFAETMGISTDVRYCACGCGTALKPGAPQTYVRGHRLGNYAKDPSVKDPDSSKRTLTSLEGKLPPEIRQDLKDKLDFVLTLVGTGWEARDPICGSEFSQRSDVIAEKLIPIIARNPELLKWLTREGTVSAWLDLAITLLPIAKIAVSHHLTHTIGQEPENQTEQLTQYPV